MRIPAVNLKPALEVTRQAWRARLEEMFARGHFILGPQVDAFEHEFARAMGARAAVGVANGTDAIALALRDAGVSGEVLTSALTAPFTGTAILHAGCKPTFADVLPETLLMDPADAARRVTKKTRALVPVHLYGQPCDMLAFNALARQHRLLVIQDAAQAHGALHRGKPLASYSSYVAFSFYPTKNLGCLGDGGAIAVQREQSEKRLRMLRDGGRNGDMVAHIPAVNSRLDEMQACYLRAFLPKLAEWNAYRARIAALYDEAFKDCPGVRPIERSPESVNHLYVIRARKRDQLRDFLERRGIGTGLHYPTPLHLMPAFKDAGLKRGDLPVSEKAAKEVLSLPLWPYLPIDWAEEVAQSVLAFYK